MFINIKGYIRLRYWMKDDEIKRYLINFIKIIVNVNRRWIIDNNYIVLFK